MYPGPFCEKHGISKDQVLNNSDTLVPIGCLENGVVLELRTFLNKSGRSELELSKILTLLEPRLSAVNQRALVSKLNRLFEQRKKLSHKKKVPGYKDAADLLNRQFESPAAMTTISDLNVESLTLLTETVDRSTEINSVPSECAKTTADSSESEPVDRNSDTSGKLEKHVVFSLNTDSPLPVLSFDNESEEILQSSLGFQVSQKSVNSLKYEYNKLEKNKNRMEREIDQKLEKLSLLESRVGHYAVKNVNKRDETAKKNLSLLRTSERSVRQLKNVLAKNEGNYQICKKQLVEVKAQNKELLSRLQDLENIKTMHVQESKKKVSAQKNASYLRLELKRMKNEARDSVNDEINDLKSVIRMKEYEIDDLQMEIIDLQDRLRMQFNTKNENGSYRDNIRLCILELTGLEVAVEKVSPTIQAVIKHVTGTEIPKSDLPNKNTVQTIVDQGHFLAKTYISEKIDSCENWGLSRDGTSRRKQKILDTAVTLDSGDIISLGFNRVTHETATTINDVTKRHLHELADLHSVSASSDNVAQHKEEYVAMSLQKLAFTMSDRASNEKLANKLLNDWREETLQNFDGDIKSVHSFHCMAHVLLGFHNYLVPDMKEMETKIAETEGPLGRDKMPVFKTWSKKQSAVERTVKTTSDTFGPAGDHYGVRDRWEAYCSANGVKSLIGNYRDNRFNAIFQTSAEVFIHMKEFLSVLETVSAPNLKLQSVKADLECNVICTMLQCLGLFFVKVSGPYWNLITSGKVPYLELHPHVGHLRQYLEGCAEEPALLLNKERYWVEADFIDIQQQRQYESLFCLVEESQVLLLDFIKLVSFAMIKVIDKQLVDFLPGGQFCKKATPDELRITKFAHLTNLGCEHHFGDLDSSQRRRPSASMHHHSSVQLLKRNREGLMQWFGEMSPDKRASLLKSARKGGRELRQIHLQDEKKVSAEVHDDMMKEKEKKSKKRRNNAKHDERENARRRNNEDSDEENEITRLETEKNLRQKLPENQSFKENEYVIIAYQDNWYPGIVISLKTETEAVIRFMSRCRKPGHFQWPMRRDEQTVLSQFVLKKGFVPDCVSSGRQWLITEYAAVDKLYDSFKTVFF